MQRLDQPATGDGLGQFLDRDPGLDPPDIGLAQHQLVEGNIARGREGDLLIGIGHGDFSVTGAESLSLGNQPVTKPSAALFLEREPRRITGATIGDQALP